MTEQAANPAPEATEQSIEERLGALWGESEPEEAAPVEDKPAETEEEPAAEQTTEVEDEAEEVEYEGKAYKVPKELKDALLRQKDYTVKTMEVANLRRQNEDKAQFLEAREQLMAATYQEAAEFKALQSQQQQYEALDWAALYNADPGQALKLRDQRDRLASQIAEKEKALQAKVQQHQQMSRAHAEKQLELGRAELQRRVGSLTEDDRRNTLQQAQTLGFSAEEIGAITDARVMHALVELARLKSKAAASASVVEKKVAQAKPVSPAARSGPQAHRDGALFDAREKLRKTGRDEYAEQLFNAMFKG